MVNPSGAAIACATAPRIVFIICKIMDIKELYTLYRRCSCVTTDSRHCPENSLFIALKGASFDGNRFAAQAPGWEAPISTTAISCSGVI